MLWTPGTATGLGPFPGSDPLEAARIVFSEAPDLPFLAELPARGVGADQVGRTAGLLADLHVEVGTGAWRFVPRGGRDEQRAHQALTTDLDALEEAAHGYGGPLKVRILGPWSLAASIELQRGEKALADPGAVRDITGSLAEGLTRHLADIHRRIPALTRLVVQIDEPLLASVLSGELSTASGWGRLRTYERAVVEDGLRQVMTGAAAGPPRIGNPGEGGGEEGGGLPHNVAGVWLGSAPLDGDLLRGAGAAFVGIDGAVLDSIDEDEVGAVVDAGLGLLVACLPLDETDHDPRPATAAVRRLWKRLGFPVAQLPEAVALAPVEGFEHLDVSAVPGVLKRTVEAARFLEEFAADGTP